MNFDGSEEVKSRSGRSNLSKWGSGGSKSGSKEGFGVKIEVREGQIDQNEGPRVQKSGFETGFIIKLIIFLTIFEIFEIFEIFSIFLRSPNSFPLKLRSAGPKSGSKRGSRDQKPYL
jgi:hypothetical protein